MNFEGDVLLSAEGYDALEARLVNVLNPFGQLWEDDELQLDLARNASGPVLELGCGTGRVLLHLALEEVDAHGIDISPHMLEVCTSNCRKLGTTVSLHQGTISPLSLDRQFSLIYSPGATWQQICNRDEAVAALISYRQHLVDGGILALSVIPKEVAPGQEDVWRLLAVVADPASDVAFMVEEASALDSNGECRDNIRRVSLLNASGTVTEQHIRRHRVRLWSQEQASAALEEAGFKHVRRVGLPDDYVVVGRT